VLLLKPHEAVAEGGENGGRERRRKQRAKPWVRMCSAWPGRHYSVRETDGWAPRCFDFFSNLSKTSSALKIQNGCLTLLQKIPIFAGGSLGTLRTRSLICKNVSYHTSANRRGLNKIKEFEFEVQTVQPFMYNLILQGFHSSFQNT
jgi:hypothetical protein